MRFQSSLVLGLSFLAAFASADSIAGSDSNAVEEKRAANDAAFLDSRGLLAEVAPEQGNHLLEVRDPRRGRPNGGQSAAGGASSRPAAGASSVVKASSTKASIVSTSAASSKSVSKASHTSTGRVTESTGVSNTRASRTTGSATGSRTSSGTASASATETGKGRLKCGEKGSTCTGSTCTLPRKNNKVRSLIDVSRRAFRTDTGAPEGLFGKPGNVDLSNSARIRTAWIPFGENKKRSATIKGLTGCTAVIAISERGMYAAHLWEWSESALAGTLAPKHYEATLATIRAELATHAGDLAGGELYLMIPYNPDQPSQLLYESKRWNKELTDDETEVGKKPTYTTRVPMSADIRAAMTGGSGLAITQEVNYLPPRDDQTPFESHMTAQYDHQHSDTQQAYGVWADNRQLGQTHVW